MARRRRSRRNKKLKKQQAGFMYVTPLAGFLVVAGVLCLSFLWLDNRCEVLGKRIKMLEREVSIVRDRRFNEEEKWAAMISPLKIDRALRRHGLDMTWSERERIVEIPYSRCNFGSDKQVIQLSHNSRQMRVAMND